MQRDLKRPRDLVRFVRLPPMRCGHPRSSTGAAGWRDEQLGSALFGRVGEAFVREKGDWPSQDPHSLSAAPLPPRRLAFAAPTLSHRAFQPRRPHAENSALKQDLSFLHDCFLVSRNQTILLSPSPDLSIRLHLLAGEAEFVLVVARFVGAILHLGTSVFDSREGSKLPPTLRDSFDRKFVAVWKRRPPGESQLPLFPSSSQLTESSSCIDLPVARWDCLCELKL